jgi:hypothetical protein
MPQRLSSRWDGSDCLFQAVQNFIYYADGSDRVPKLSKGRRYAQFKISDMEWIQLGLIHEVLQVGVCSIVMLLADKPFYANQPWSRKSPTYSMLSRVKANRQPPRQFSCSNGCRHVGSRWPSMNDTGRLHPPLGLALTILASGTGSSMSRMRMSCATVRCLTLRWSLHFLTV